MSVRTTAKRGSDVRNVEFDGHGFVVSASGNGNGRVYEQIAVFLAALKPRRGVDALLSRPFEAIRFAADVARAVDRIEPAEWNALTADLGVFEMKHAAAIAAIGDVCRAAMNGRKGNKLRLPARRGGRS